MRHHPSDPIIQPLESQGIKRLYPQNVDHKKELKKMNHSLLANFLDLIDVMVKNPGGPKHPGSPPPGIGSLREEKIEDIQLLFFHMHHLVNEFRPHQVCVCVCVCVSVSVSVCVLVCVCVSVC